MNERAFTLRAGGPDDLAELVSIDDDAGRLFASAGLDFAGLTPDHPFVCSERARWLAAARCGKLELALSESGRAIGFMALGSMDGEPYLEQLSVRCSGMRRGIGSMFMERARAWAAERARVLWLTTYSHIAWNRSFYERFGFQVVPESGWGPELRACVHEQRGALPAPEQRIAMRCPVDSADATASVDRS